MKRRIRWENKNFDDMGTLSHKVLFSYCRKYNEFRPTKNCYMQNKLYRVFTTLILLMDLVQRKLLHEEMLDIENNGLNCPTHLFN